jgi:site-specific DNA-cytosine methylase
MKILVACEESQAVTKEFRALGHEAYSCDIQECSGGHPEWHLQQDVTEVLKQDWDMVIAFPPCTHLAVSGAAHFAKKIADGRQQQGIDFFMLFANCKCQRVAIENPIGIMSSKWRKPDQIIEPYYFGDPHKKPTCLWLKGLPKLTWVEQDTIFDKKTSVVPEMVTMKSKKTGRVRTYSKWEYENGCKNYYDGTRAKDRAKTFPGIAKAMAIQWSNI